MAMKEEDRHQMATAIAATLLQEVYWPKVKRLHCFEPIMHLGEVDLVDFVTALRTDKADVEVYTSRKIDGEWKVVDTADDTPVKDVPKFDVVVVPMLGFDERLHRVGYGGGYYDKFLAAQPQARKVGVCYQAGMVPQIPAEPQDVPLDMIITEEGVHTP